MTSDASDAETVSNRVIGCAIEVHRILGPSLLESVYRECLLIELQNNLLRAESECRIPLKYDITESGIETIGHPDRYAARKRFL